MRYESPDTEPQHKQPKLALFRSYTVPLATKLFRYCHLNSASVTKVERQITMRDPHQREAAIEPGEHDGTVTTVGRNTLGRARFVNTGQSMSRRAARDHKPVFSCPHNSSVSVLCMGRRGGTHKVFVEIQRTAEACRYRAVRSASYCEAPCARRPSSRLALATATDTGEVHSLGQYTPVPSVSRTSGLGVLASESGSGSAVDSTAKLY